MRVSRDHIIKCLTLGVNTHPHFPRKALALTSVPVQLWLRPPFTLESVLVRMINSMVTQPKGIPQRWDFIICELGNHWRILSRGTTGLDLCSQHSTCRWKKATCGSRESYRKAISMTLGKKLVVNRAPHFKICCVSTIILPWSSWWKFQQRSLRCTA